MNNVFLETMRRIERVFSSPNEQLTSNEQQLLNLVLSDFKESIETGRLDRFVDRKNSYRYEVFCVNAYHDHLVYSRSQDSAKHIKSIPYMIDKSGFQKLETILEQIGFEVKLSGYGYYKGSATPFHAFFTVPRNKTGR